MDQKSSSSSLNKGRIDGLDLLRTLAILFVLMNHIAIRLGGAKVPYRQGMSHAEAMVVLHRLAGQKLDPHCVAAVAVARDPWTVWTPTTASPHPPRRGPMSVTSGIRAAAGLS